MNEENKSIGVVNQFDVETTPKDLTWIQHKSLM